MHISVATFPTPPLSIERELAMLKVALLYGDTVTLHSPIAALLMSATERATNFTTFERLSLKIRLASLYEPDKEEDYRYRLKTYEEACRREEGFLVSRTPYKIDKRRVPPEIKIALKDARGVKKRIDDTLQDDLSALDETADEYRYKFNIHQLDKAVEVGRLKINDLQFDKIDAYELLFRQNQHEDIGHLLEKPTTEMTREVMNLMFSPNKLYPFVDSKFGEAFRLSAQMSNTKPPLNRVQASKAKNVSLVSQMFELLPGFKEAPLDEILGIQDELSDALVRFRGAVGEYAELIESTSWDLDFEAEAAKVLEEKIKPAVKEIEERVEDNSYLHQLTTQVKGNALKDLLGLAVASTFTLRSEYLVEALTALGLLLSRDVVWAARKKLDEARAIEREKIFFYYKLSKRFKS